MMSVTGLEICDKLYEQNVAYVLRKSTFVFRDSYTTNKPLWFRFRPHRIHRVHSAYCNTCTAGVARFTACLYVYLSVCVFVCLCVCTVYGSDTPMTAAIQLNRSSFFRKQKNEGGQTRV